MTELRARAGFASTRGSRFADVRGVNRLAAQNHAETDDGGQTRRSPRQPFGHDGNFIRAGTRMIWMLETSARTTPLGRPQHRIHVTRIVAGRDNGERAAVRLIFFWLYLAKHRGGFNHECMRMNTNNL